RLSVEVGAPTTLIRRGFQTHPNPNYARHVDPDGSPVQAGDAASSNSRLFSPTANATTTPRYSDGYSTASDLRSSGYRRGASLGGSSAAGARQPAAPPAPASATAGASHGGSLGVYTHVNSPLKKATSLNDLNSPAHFSPRNSRELAAI